MIPLSNAAQLAHVTTRIVCKKPGKLEFGTAFFFNFSDSAKMRIPVIVTNRHVIEGALSAQINIANRDKDVDRPIIGEYSPIDWIWAQSPWLIHPDPAVDLAIAPLADLAHVARDKGIRLFYKTIDLALIPADNEYVDFDIAEEVLMIGYPNGLWDSANNMPILRRGITSTHVGLNYEGKSDFLIDIPCHKGSSGSPVFIFNEYQYTSFSGDSGQVMRGQRVKFVGVLHSGPIKHEQVSLIDPEGRETGVRADIKSFFNIGQCVRASRLKEFIPIIQSLIELGGER